MASLIVPKARSREQVSGFDLLSLAQKAGGGCDGSFLVRLDCCVSPALVAVRQFDVRWGKSFSRQPSLSRARRGRIALGELVLREKFFEPFGHVGACRRGRFAPTCQFQN